MRILRTLLRAVALATALLFCMVDYGWRRRRGPLTLEERAMWLQAACRGVIRALGIHYELYGQPATHGLVVSNHLSYLDILILSSAMPCFFVAKMEIGGWPFFGKAAQLGGTLFLDRGSHASSMSVARQMTERLRLPVPMLLFPEGTSSDGSEVLPFHPRLIDPATAMGAPITAASVRYTIDGGVEEKELCWYGDVSFLPHLVKALGVKGFSAELRFGLPQIYADRREAANTTRAEVMTMRAAGVR